MFYLLDIELPNGVVENPHSLSSSDWRIDCGDFYVLGCVDANIVFRFAYTDFKTAGIVKGLQVPLLLGFQ